MRIESLRRNVLGLALLVGGLSLPSQAAPAGAEGGDLFPVPSAGLAIEVNADDPVTLDELLLTFAELSGEHLIWAEETGMVLRSQKTGFRQSLDIPPEDVYSVIETILIAHRFVFTDLRREEPRMMAVYSLDSPARSSIRADATYVPPEKLELYADHPGILIHTVLTLDRLDVRTLGNAMRAMVVDPNTMQMVPIPGSSSLILTGFGTNIVQLARMLTQMNEDAREPERVRTTRASSAPFPTPAEGMTLEGRGGMALTLEELLLEFGRVSGEHLVWSEDHAQVLKATWTNLDRQVVVPPEELYSVIENILITSRFVLTDLRREEPRMMAVYSLDSPVRSRVRADARYVPPEKLELYADHPAILITTMVHLPKIDIRTMGNAMRAMVVDPNTMQLVPIPESDRLVLTGFGSSIVEMVGMLQELNDNAPEPQEPETPEGG